MRKTYKNIQDFFEINFPKSYRNFKEKESDIQIYIRTSSVDFSKKIETIIRGES